MKRYLYVFMALWVVVLMVCQNVVLASERPSNSIVNKIAFGSCADQDEPQPIWDAIVKEGPDLYIHVGDNIYGDTFDMSVLKAKYQALASKPVYQKLISTTPILSVWDDHDYGINDSGADYGKRKESEQVFLDFFNIPQDSPRRQRPGVYGAKMFGKPGKLLQIILLDTRYFRSPLQLSTMSAEEKEKKILLVGMCRHPIRIQPY